MAVVIQKLTGTIFDNFFYPAVSGVAQSYNFYPISQMKPEEGIAQIALGLGKTVVEGETSLRFSPTYRQSLPIAEKTTYLIHVKLDKPLTVIIDGEKPRAVILP